MGLGPIPKTCKVLGLDTGAGLPWAVLVESQHGWFVTATFPRLSRGPFLFLQTSASGMMDLKALEVC